MNNKEKFENFLESLKGNGQDELIESVKQGFQVCFEYSEHSPDAKGIDIITNPRNIQEISVISKAIELGMSQVDMLTFRPVNERQKSEFIKHLMHKNVDFRFAGEL